MRICGRSPSPRAPAHRLGRALVAALVLASVLGAASPASAATFTVNTTNDVNDGTCNGSHCSLREAINAANALAGADTIAFDIAGPTPHTIAPTSALPTISTPMAIDGSTEPDYQTGAPVVELTGINRGQNDFWSGFELTGGQSTVKGLVINRFFRGIRIQTAGNNTITGNFIGTNAQGIDAAGRIFGPAVDVFTSNNTIGGPAVADRNVLSFSGTGVHLQAAASQNQVLGNYIGTNAAGSGEVSNGLGVQIDGDTNVVGAPSDGNVISGGIDQSWGGVLLNSQANNNTIAGNLIGTDATGEEPLGNRGPGITVFGAGNFIGGSSPGAGNVISGNGLESNPRGGIQLAAGSNSVLGNYIGVDATGDEALGNWGPGIAVTSASNVIGGDSPGAGNVVSANKSAGGFQANGIDLNGSNANNNIIRGNKVGTDATGTLDFGNANRGILLNGAPNNTVGGSTPGAGNLISGNAWEGISVSGSNGNIIQGNKIGTDITGQSTLGNSGFGLVIQGSNTQVGGASAGAGNLISGHTNAPAIWSSSPGNTFQGNKIGTNASGQSAIPNQGGIEVPIGGVSNTLIGGELPGAGNTVAFNDTFGVRVNGTGNRIVGNSIHSNGGNSTFWRGITLTSDVPSNDAGDGDTGNNNLQNFPVLTSVAASNNTVMVGGTLSSEPNKTYRVEFFNNTECDPSGHGEGKTFLGAQDVAVGGTGVAAFSFDAGNIPTPGDFITATATDPAGNTSEFSRCKRYNRPPVLNPIGNKMVAEAGYMTFTISASDIDGDSPLIYSASNLPQGAVFSPSNRTFEWFPSYTQAGTHENVRFEVSDGNGGTDFEEITITVANTNRAPVLGPIGDQVVAEGSELNLDLNATDPDGDQVTYSATDLPPGDPVLAPENGVFSWVPGYSQAGEYEVTFISSDGSLTDSETITITVTDTDIDQPVVSMDSPLDPFVRAKSFQVSWSATDDKSGVASYDVAYREAYDSALGELIAWLTDTSVTSATFVGKPGFSYCFSARATDGAGNSSDYTEERCTAVPLDDVQLRKSADWTRSTGSGYYLKTFTAGKERGAALSLASVTSDRLALVATRCPGCGTVKVFLGQTQLKKVSLNATRVMKKQLIPIKTFGSTATGKVKIVISSDGKPVKIEGLGIAVTPD